STVSCRHRLPVSPVVKQTSATVSDRASTSMSRYSLACWSSTLTSPSSSWRSPSTRTALQITWAEAEHATLAVADNVATEKSGVLAVKGTEYATAWLAMPARAMSAHIALVAILFRLIPGYARL